MASSKARARKLARAKMERQMVRRAQRARRNRQIQAGIAAAVAVVLVILGAVWLAGGFSSRPKPAAVGDCAWTPSGTASKDVGQPPTTGIQKTGTEQMTITTNQGTVIANLEPAKAPCTVANFKYLASKKYFDGTKCHRLTTGGIFVLQCGDPTGSGSGGPGYSFPDENLPVAAAPSAAASSAAPSGSATPPGSATPVNSATPARSASASGSARPSSSAASPTPSASASSAASTYTYPAGTLAMANSGPDTNGSQFFIVYKDSPLPPNYTIFGQVTSGLDMVTKVAAAGVANGATDGAPKTPVTIQSLTVGTAAPPAAPTPSGTPSAPPTSTPASPSAKS